MPEPVSRQLDQACTYFSNSIRVPAALIAGQAGAMLFRLTDPSKRALPRPPAATTAEPQEPHSSAAFTLLWRAHLMLTGYALCMQLTCVLVCSTAHAQILDIGRDELALEPTALDLIIRHVEFEYVTVRIAFFSGIVAFLLAITARGAALLGAGPRGSSPTGKSEITLLAGLIAMLASTLCGWAHIYNEDMTNFTGLWPLLLRFGEMLPKRLSSSPTAAVSALLAVASAALTLGSLRSSH